MFEYRNYLYLDDVRGFLRSVVLDLLVMGGYGEDEGICFVYECIGISSQNAKVKKIDFELSLYFTHFLNNKNNILFLIFKKLEFVL